ncbi:hypothetical protein MRB53_004979 [Persea americana]|uniref:Uncharacterized protein n=1 Tax=Persea americana TaxID=3435 RepID=A0ACC2MC60_PERAE|nr:hypothetical protein MRB53_004979 [Persea americana]
MASPSQRVFFEHFYTKCHKGVFFFTRVSKENPNLFLEEEGHPLSLLYVWVGIHARLPQERYYKFEGIAFEPDNGSELLPLVPIEVVDEAMDLNKELMSKLLELDGIDTVYSDKKLSKKKYEHQYLMHVTEQKKILIKHYVEPLLL